MEGRDSGHEKTLGVDEYGHNLMCGYDSPGIVIKPIELYTLNMCFFLIRQLYPNEAVRKKKRNWSGYMSLRS